MHCRARAARLPSAAHPSLSTPSGCRCCPTVWFLPRWMWVNRRLLTAPRIWRPLSSGADLTACRHPESAGPCPGTADSGWCGSIRAPVGGATGGTLKRCGGCRVSIRAPAGGATLIAATQRHPAAVSIRAPAGERPASAGQLATRNLFQSALPRGERPQPRDVGSDWQIVSIRAPAGGATGIYSQAANLDQFQSALPRGSDVRTDGGATAASGSAVFTGVFQSALPRGSDPCSLSS